LTEPAVRRGRRPLQNRIAAGCDDVRDADAAAGIVRLASSFSRVANLVVAETPAIRRSPRSVERNVRLPERAMTTPISSYLATSVPPALAILVGVSDGTACAP
jgi:hypothetical protein